MVTTADVCLATALTGWDAGLSMLLVRQDGSKQPGGIRIHKWKRRQQHRCTRRALERLYRRRELTGVGFATGKVSGHVRLFEFDDYQTFLDFLDAAEAVGLANLVVRVRAGYEETTPGGGIHWLIRCPVEGGNTPLARRPAPTAENPHSVKTLIETREDGGFVIVAPSNGRVHPSGGAYALVSGGFTTIATLTPDEWDDLRSLARTFDALPARQRTRTSSATNMRPGDEYNQRATWREVLEPHGWTFVFERNDIQYWRRPGKNRGVSATINATGRDTLIVFSSSTDFEVSPASHDKFGAYAMLNHHGDLPAAARAIATVRRGSTARHDSLRGSHLPKGFTHEDVNPLGRCEPLNSASIIDMERVQPGRVRWLWPGRIPFGKLTVLDGDPGLGKSLLTLDLAARISRGIPMPDGSMGDRAGPATVLLISAEDDPADTIRPRLDAAGADVARIKLVVGVRDGEGHDRDIAITDVDELEAIIQQTGAVAVVVDPLMAFIPSKVDSHRDQDIRGVLRPLAGVAARTGAAMLVVRHLNKVAGGNALYRGGGSIGIIGAARSGLLVARDPDDPNGERVVLALTKSNLARPAPALTYCVEDRDGVPVIAWGGVTAHTAGSLLAAPAGEERSARDEATDFLRDVLADGPRLAKEIQREARDRNIADMTLKRARWSLSVEAFKEGFGSTGAWLWRLPDALRGSPDPKGFNPEHVNPFGSGEPLRGEDARADATSDAAEGVQNLYCETNHAHRSSPHRHVAGEWVCSWCTPTGDAT